MEPPPASDSLHRRVAEAIERGAQAQQRSRVLLEHHRALDAALRDTMASIGERRRLIDHARSVNGGGC